MSEHSQSNVERMVDRHNLGGNEYQLGGNLNGDLQGGEKQCIGAQLLD
jgi:hypothetical protein